jgi:hypothetical protein
MSPAEELSRYWIDGEQCSAVPYTRGANYDTVLCPTTTLAQSGRTSQWHAPRGKPTLPVPAICGHVKFDVNPALAGHSEPSHLP